MRSRIIWLARKVSTRRGAIGTSTPVLGLRPTRSPLSRSTNVPKPEIFTFSPRLSAAHISARICSTIFAESARLNPTSRCSVSARSARVSVLTGVINTDLAPLSPPFFNKGHRAGKGAAGVSF